MLNVENIDLLIEVIHDEDNNFDMSYYEMCGTPGCISGWCFALLNEEDQHRICDGPDDDIDKSAAQVFLNATKDQVFKITYPDTKKEWNSITRKHAIEMLRKFRDTGEVDWSHVDAD